MFWASNQKGVAGREAARVEEEEQHLAWSLQEEREGQFKVRDPITSASVRAQGTFVCEHLGSFQSPKRGLPTTEFQL